ncbi:uncharacterized protein LOC131852736 [Achroia grisella]|uniref:uncharacterized protein LOC131852736 n=1 Tax=Achroia grisella TaxID=688607 RepID=UPI0027D2F835|nr:uncharacterized protein LOC131852736 [Achroia grisella]
MPKRKNSDNDLDSISKKIKKLEKKLKRMRRRRISDSSSHDSAPASDEQAIFGTVIQGIINGFSQKRAEYGRDIHKELANRLQHIATDGLTKETRRELCSKYLIPANSTKFAAPLVNAEIKAALSEITIKRDKGIESRQKQLASAISGLAGVLNQELNSKDRDSSRLKTLMDVTRILCDIQHAESVTRRYLAMSTIKKDLREHLTNTKIDKYLFGENLSETLKTAKTVSKSGSDLKIKTQTRPYLQNTTGNLNYKAPVLARRQQQGPQRSRGPAPRTTGPRQGRYSQNPTHFNSSKPSQPPPKPSGRR